MESVVEAARQHPDNERGDDAESMARLLAEDPGLFLERYGAFLGQIQLRAVAHRHSDNAHVQAWLNVLLPSHARTASETAVRNRRLKYLETVLTAEDDYWSEAEMRRRDPAGWRYFAESSREVDEPLEGDTEAGRGLGGFMLRSMQQRQMRVAEALQMQADASVSMDLGSGPDDAPAELMDQWKALHRARFLAGEDEFFDYSLVDHNEKYDDFDTMRRDEEEKWFDAD